MGALMGFLKMASNSTANPPKTPQTIAVVIWLLIEVHVSCVLRTIENTPGQLKRQVRLGTLASAGGSSIMERGYSPRL